MVNLGEIKKHIQSGIALVVNTVPKSPHRDKNLVHCLNELEDKRNKLSSSLIEGLQLTPAGYKSAITGLLSLVNTAETKQLIAARNKMESLFPQTIKRI